MFTIAVESPKIRLRPVPNAQNGARTVIGCVSETWPGQVTFWPLLAR